MVFYSFRKIYQILLPYQRATIKMNFKKLFSIIFLQLTAIQFFPVSFEDYYLVEEKDDTTDKALPFLRGTYKLVHDHFYWEDDKAKKRDMTENGVNFFEKGPFDPVCLCWFQPTFVFGPAGFFVVKPCSTATCIILRHFCNDVQK